MEVWTDNTDRSGTDYGAQDIPIILAFDEARALLEIVPNVRVSKFRMLRSVLRKMFLSSNSGVRHLKVIAVLIDTSSKINDFPQRWTFFASSLRGTDFDFSVRSLFHPYILYGTSDPRFTSSRGHDLSHLAKSTEYLRAGRPLVTQYADSDSIDLTLLQFKLRGTIGQKTTSTGSLAVMLAE
jgi:hypothetical protein